MVNKFSISQVEDAKKVMEQLPYSVKVTESQPFDSKKILIVLALIDLMLWLDKTLSISLFPRHTNRREPE